MGQYARRKNTLAQQLLAQLAEGIQDDAPCATFPQRWPTAGGAPVPTLLGIHGSVTQPGRLHQALALALQSTGDRWKSVATSLLHLGDHRISFADGRPLSEYGDDTEAVVQQVMAADMYLIATPIFRASFTASLKNLLDLVPVEGLMGKVCGVGGHGCDGSSLPGDRQPATAGALLVRRSSGARRGLSPISPVPGRPVVRPQCSGRSRNPRSCGNRYAAGHGGQGWTAGPFAPRGGVTPPGSPKLFFPELSAPSLPKE